MGLLSGAKKAVLKRVHDLIDDQVTKKLEPFLEVGTGPDGQVCSDFVVDECGDMSIENMIVKTSVANEALAKKGLPLRVAMMRAKRIAIDIPWENFTSGVWKLEVLGLSVLLHPLEREGWDLDSLRQAKEASVEVAVAALIKKLKALDDVHKKPNSFIESIKHQLSRHVDITVTVRDIHIRMEREDGMRVGAPQFCAGFVLPSMSVTTHKADAGLETVLKMGKAGVYVHHGKSGGICVSAAARSAGAVSPLAACRASGVASGVASPSPTDKDQATFFIDQNRMRDDMGKIAADAGSWDAGQWFFLFAGADEGSDCLSATVTMDSTHSDEPGKFDYERPLQITSCHVGVLSVQATEMQLASFMSITTHLSEYKLWSSFQIMRQVMQLPSATGAAGDDEKSARARLLWRVACRAVTYSLDKAKVKTSNLTQILWQAKAYKKAYAEFLSGSGLTDKTIVSADARCRARSEQASGRQAALLEYEDLLPVDTLAWCRLVAQNHTIKEQKKNASFSHSFSRSFSQTFGRASSAGADGDGEKDGGLHADESIDESDDIERMEALESVVTSDPRLQEAPDRYVSRAVDIRIHRFKLQLLRSLDVTEQIEQGLGYRNFTGTRGVELMTLTVSGVHVRSRVVKSIGRTVNLVVTSIVSRAGRAGNGGHPNAPPKPLVLRFDDSMYGGAVPDSMLGGSIEHPGSIDDFLSARREALRGYLSRAGSFAYRRLPSLARGGRRGGSGETTEDEGASNASAAMCVFTLASSNPDAPNEMAVQIAKVFVEYSPPFWIALEAFLRPVERVKWASQLGETSMLRVRHSKLYRACDKLMKEAWHTPQIKIMTVFMELSDFLGLPTARHKLDVSMSGFEFKLLSEKDDSTEEIMRAELPPMKISKAPRVGQPMPPVQTMQIQFLEPINVESIIEKGAFARVLSINTNGGAYSSFSRLGGTRDILHADVQSLHQEVQMLEAERERLTLQRDQLRSASLASALGVVESQAKAVPAGYGSPLYASPAMQGAVAPTASAVAAQEAEASAARQELQQRLASIEASVGEVATYVRETKGRHRIRRGMRSFSLFSPRASKKDVRDNAGFSAVPTPVKASGTPLKRHTQTVAVQEPTASALSKTNDADLTIARGDAE